MKMIRSLKIFLFIFCGLLSLVLCSERVSQATREETDRLKSYLNRIIDPCKDFYSYSCENYVRNVKKTYDGYLIGVSDILVGKVNHQVKNLLTERRSNASSYERKAILFYKTCESSLSDLTKLRYQFNEFVKSLSIEGGWPVWRDTWRTDRFHWFKTIANLKLYGFHPIIDGRIAPYRRNTTGKTFLINAIPQIGYDRAEDTKDRFYISKYLEELKRIFLDFGVAHNEASDFAREVLEFEKGLQQIVGDWIYYNDDTYDEFVYHRFKTKFWNVDWDHYFETVFGFHELKGSYIVSVKGGRFLKQIIDYVSRTPPSIVANFLLTSIVTNSFDLRHPTTKPNFCVSATSEAMNPVVGLMYMHRYFDEQAEIDVYGMVKSLALAHLQIWNSLIEEDDTILELKNKLDNMRITFLSDHVDILERAAHSYLTIDVDIMNFVKTYFRFIRHNNFRDTPRDYVRYMVLNSALQTEPFYVEEKNALVIPPTVMQVPYYHRSWPKLLKYSKLGFLISRSMAHAFDSYGRKMDANGNSRNWWSVRNDISQQIEQNLIIKYNGLSYDGVPIDGRLTLRENWADLFGIRGAFKAYLNKLSERRYSEPVEAMGRISLSSNQTFFASYAQLFCEEHIQYEPSDTYSPPKLRVNGPTSWLEEFKFAFGCN